MKIAAKILLLIPMIYLTSCTSVSDRKIASDQIPVLEEDQFKNYIKQQRTQYLNKVIGPIWFQSLLLSSPNSSSKVVSFSEYEKRVQLVKDFISEHNLDRFTVIKKSDEELSKMEEQIKEIIGKCCDPMESALELDSNYPYVEQAFIANNIWQEGYSGLGTGTLVVSLAITMASVILDLRAHDHRASREVRDIRVSFQRLIVNYGELELRKSEVLKAANIPMTDGNRNERQLLINQKLAEYNNVEKVIQARIAQIQKLYETPSQINERLKNLRITERLADLEKYNDRLNTEGRELLAKVDSPNSPNHRESWQANNRANYFRTSIGALLIGGIIVSEKFLVKKYKQKKLGKYYEQFKKFLKPGEPEYNLYQQDVYNISTFNKMTLDLLN